MLTGLNDAARAELEDLRISAGGLLRPDDVVERARSQNSALHKYFEWDDTEAAAAYRMHQARQVIRVVVRLIPRQASPSVAVRAYISLPSDRAQGGYRAVEDVANDETRAAEAMMELRRLLTRMEMRYGALASVSDVLARIGDILNQQANPAE